MKLFGNTSKPRNNITTETGPVPQVAPPEDAAEFGLSGKDFETRLDLLLDGKKLKSPSQLQAEPPKEMGKPVNTDYHIIQDPIRGTKVKYDEDEEEEGGTSMSGWLKGTLLLIASLIVLVLVVFGVYINLI